MALAIAAAALWLAQRQPARTGGERKMLVVLPFTNFTGDPAQEHFCDGLTEELIAALSRLNPQQLGVIARTSAMRYKIEQKPVNQIKTELGVDFLIEGSVRNEAGQLRITVQLIRASDQSHLWALSFDRPHRDTLGVQREVSESVARSLTLELLPARAPRPDAEQSAGTRSIFERPLPTRQTNRRCRPTSAGLLSASRQRRPRLCRSIYRAGRGADAAQRQPA